MTNKDKITIIALGWLGKALFSTLENKRSNVSGSYRHNSKGCKDEFKYDFLNSIIPKQILDSNVVIFNLPPSKMGDFNNFTRFIDTIREKEIIFISSTSVYGIQGTVDEETAPVPVKANGKFLLKCEKYIIKNVKRYKIIRPSGLYGEGRHPARYLSGKRGVKGQNLPINLVSREDLVNLIINAMEYPESLIINASNKNHPTKKKFYTLVCKENSLPIPTFEIINESQNKIITTKYSYFEINTSLDKGLT
jgi:hypothetical protein